MVWFSLSFSSELLVPFGCLKPFLVPSYMFAHLLQAQQVCHIIFSVRQLFAAVRLSCCLQTGNGRFQRARKLIYLRATIIFMLTFPVSGRTEGSDGIQLPCKLMGYMKGAGLPALVLHRALREGAG